jgi:hypothetical protein
MRREWCSDNCGVMKWCEVTKSFSQLVTRKEEDGERTSKKQKGWFLPFVTIHFNVENSDETSFWSE